MNRGGEDVEQISRPELSDCPWDANNLIIQPKFDLSYLQSDHGDMRENRKRDSEKIESRTKFVEKSDQTICGLGQL